MSIQRTVENVYLRQEAVQLVRKHFWRLLGLTLLIGLIVYGLDAGLTALGDLLLKKESQDVIDAAAAYSQAATLSSTSTLLAAQTDLLLSPKYLVYNLFFIIATGLVSGALALGRHAQLLNAARGGKPRILGAFCRMRQCLKAWGLTLFIGLKTCLWALPGLLVFFLGIELQAFELFSLGNIIGCVGIGLIIGLVAPASLRYCMATFSMADEPERGIRECVNLSKGLTAGRKWQIFKLGVPAVLKIAGVAYAYLIVIALAAAFMQQSQNTAVIVFAVIVLISLLAVTGVIVYFGLQMDMVYALFYLKRRHPTSDAPVSYWLRDAAKEDPAKAAPVSYWLRDHTAADLPPAADEAPESPDAPAESDADSPEDTSPETNEEKENHNEQPVC